MTRIVNEFRCGRCGKIVFDTYEELLWRGWYFGERSLCPRCRHLITIYRGDDW